MGEARRRGAFEDRRKEAMKRDKAQLVRSLGGKDPLDDENLRAGIAPFLNLMSADKWRRRKDDILESLKGIAQGVELEKAKPIRVREDEIAWYLFLCEQALDDPLCMDVNQVARAAPFFAGIGSRWPYKHRVVGLEEKIREILHKAKKTPDGLLFEILVALSYAAKGWNVELLKQQPPSKSPDMVVRKDGLEIFVECKRLDRRTAYAERERDEFLRLWDAAKHLLLEKQQWVWFKGIFHVEVSALPGDFLTNIFQNALPIRSSGELLIYDGAEATIHARLIDKYAVWRHLSNWQVKTNSPMLSHLLGGDWAPMNSAVSITHLVKLAYVNGCDAPVLGTYIQEMDWACGFTRDFDSEVSLDKKAKDITSLLTDAISQVPTDKASIIHIAAETMEGNEVEKLRTQKVMASVPALAMEKPVLGVRFHRFQANQTIDKLWEFDETVEKFQVAEFTDNDIPLNVVTPETTELKHGAHWEIYP